MILKLHHCCIFLVAIYSTAILSTEVAELDEIDELLEAFADDESDVAVGEATNDEGEKEVDLNAEEDDEYQLPLETRELVRMCGSVRCDPMRFTALTEALCGYNIITGDPYSSIAGESIDPGIKNRIFNPTKSMEGQMTLFGVTVRNKMACDAGIFSEVVTSVRQFQRTITRTSSQKTGFGHSNSAEVEVSPIEQVKVTTTVEEKAEAAFTNSKTMGRVEKFFESGEGVMVMVQAQCLTNALSLKMFQMPPFDSAFRATVILLSNTSSESEAKKKQIFKKFIGEYGTHFIQSATMGAKMMETTFVKNSAKSDFTSDRLKKCAGRSFDLKFLGFGLSHKSEECSDVQTQELEKGSSEVIDQVTVTRGSRPKGDVKSWAAQEFTPAVLKMELKPIVNLLSDDIIYRQQGLQKDVDASALRSWFVPMYNNVCAVNGWNCKIPKGCGFTSNCKYNEQCVVIDKRRGTFKCEALDLCKKKNGGCDHKCAMSRKAVKCTCNAGFKLKLDKKSCEEEKYGVIALNTDCWKKCKKVAGKCITGKCGKDGYCCRHGWDRGACPAELDSLATRKTHTCMLYTTKKKTAIRLEWKSCWKKCGKKSGSCPGLKGCGKGGFCCKKGRACPTDLANVAGTKIHLCVGYMADKGMGIGKLVLDGHNQRIPCWNGCSKKTGKCPSVCGTGGYCCRRDRTGLACPIELQAAAIMGSHSCVKIR